jgi:hypothetical protein
MPQSCDSTQWDPIGFNVVQYNWTMLNPLGSRHNVCAKVCSHVWSFSFVTQPPYLFYCLLTDKVFHIQTIKLWNPKDNQHLISIQIIDVMNLGKPWCLTPKDRYRVPSAQQVVGPTKNYVVGFTGRYTGRYLLPSTQQVVEATNKQTCS